MRQGTRDPALDHLDPMVGEWEIEATHPYIPNTVIGGRAAFEWLPGGFFLIWRARYDHPQIPDSIAILGCHGSGDPDRAGGGCSMHYFDERGVSRVYRFGADGRGWRFWREWPGFSQRFVFTISADGRTVLGNGELSRDGATWEQDLSITYRRVE